MFNAHGSVTCVVNLYVVPEPADDSGGGMDQDIWNRGDGHLAQGAKMIAAAVASAVLTATLVIAIGQSMVDRQASARPSSDAVLIRTSG